MKKEINHDLRLAFFTFMFVVEMDVLLEIFEFAMNQYFGMIVYKHEIVDTMLDFGTIGVGELIISFLK
jgi:hypothetical protein